jgi:hypothetical protein
VGVVFVSLYAGIAQGFHSVQMARENLRATQIMLEKMEVIRLLTWSQITSNNFVPPTFTAAYDPNPLKNGGGGGAVFQGTVTISSAALATDYDADLKRVDVKVNWTTRGIARSREMTTYYSKYGVQNYLLGR